MKSVALISFFHHAETYFFTVHFKPVWKSSTFSSRMSESASEDEELPPEEEEEEEEEEVGPGITLLIISLF